MVEFRGVCRGVHGQMCSLPCPVLDYVGHVEHVGKGVWGSFPCTSGGFLLVGLMVGGVLLGTGTMMRGWMDGKARGDEERSERKG